MKSDILNFKPKLYYRYFAEVILKAFTAKKSGRNSFLELLNYNAQFKRRQFDITLLIQSERS